jgi:hypothetical protein
MAVNEIEGRYQYEKPMGITPESLIKGKEAAMQGKPLREVQAIYTNGSSELRPQMNDELRRLSMALIAVMKRNFPNDWRRMLEKEMAR